MVRGFMMIALLQITTIKMSRAKTTIKRTFLQN